MDTINPTSQALSDRISAAALAIEDKVIAWRRDIHQNPELSYQETRTASLAAEHLGKLGIEVKTGVGITGVVGILKGGKPGGIVALRADMDALPVEERVDLPFASRAKAQWLGQTVPVMHACGHDAHVAILMGVAEILASLREEIAGTVKFLFQPNEEGSYDGRPSGAQAMIDDGVFGDPVPTAVFGLHVTSAQASGAIALRPAGLMASADSIKIDVQGRQTHGSSPWRGVDPVVTAAQIILALQTIPSRQLDVTKTPAVLTIATVHGGVRANIIPDTLEMQGTIRTHDEAVRADIWRRLEKTATTIAESQGATATVEVSEGVPVTYNDPPLTAWGTKSLGRGVGEERVTESRPVMGAEDFSILAQKVPGMFFFLGVTPPGEDPREAPANHSPLFHIHEPALKYGVRALAYLAIDYLNRR
ncbi:MAG: amidohydrolase [Reyranella sp.]|uniref:amidohydrolase n=1 Tax=Reyranella sp. TaxID=1929291 RepID=UPI001ACBEEC0|nr:amidohydrolase [Reyranella sp.]MBN9090487.1 amidohydrolase [Reyranella sp.]